MAALIRHPLMEIHGLGSTHQ